MDRSRLGPDRLPVPLWRRAWLDSYPPDVPSSLSYPNVPLSALLESAARQFPERTACSLFGRTATYTQVQDQARRLARLLRGVKAKVNLIPFNDWEGSRFQRPPLPRILAFQSVLLEAGITTTVRWSKGEDIGAACGQLREPIPA